VSAYLRAVREQYVAEREEAERDAARWALPGAVPFEPLFGRVEPKIANTPLASVAVERVVTGDDEPDHYEDEDTQEDFVQAYAFETGMVVRGWPAPVLTQEESNPGGSSDLMRAVLVDHAGQRLRPADVIDGLDVLPPAWPEPPSLSNPAALGRFIDDVRRPKVRRARLPRPVRVEKRPATHFRAKADIEVAQKVVARWTTPTRAQVCLAHVARSRGLTLDQCRQSFKRGRPSTQGTGDPRVFTAADMKALVNEVILDARNYYDVSVSDAAKVLAVHRASVYDRLKPAAQLVLVRCADCHREYRITPSVRGFPADCARCARKASVRPRTDPVLAIIAGEPSCLLPAARQPWEPVYRGGVRNREEPPYR